MEYRYTSYSLMMDKNISYNYKVLDTTGATDEADFNENTVISPVLRFWILVVPLVPSVVCSLFVLWFLLRKAEYRCSLIHRTVIIQLIAGLIFLLISIPIYLNYLRLEYVWPESPALCQVWWLLGELYQETMTILMAWGSFERHIFIFHDQWLTTMKNKMIIHYIPVTLIIVYHFIYYFTTMAFPPCENVYDYSEDSCGLSCFHENTILRMFDVIINEILFTILVAIISISLIVRILLQSRRHHGQGIQWRKHRKVIIILLSISAIYLCCNLPMMILQLAKFFGLSEEDVEHIEPYLDLLKNFVFILYPFVCAATFFLKLRRSRRNQVNPAARMTITQNMAIAVPNVQ